MKTVIRDYDDSTWYIVAFEEEFTSNTKNVLYLEAPGKIIASMSTQWLIDNYFVENIINVGTAGGNPSKVEIGKIYEVGKVYDRDFITPSTKLPFITVGRGDLKSCYTGDSFVTSWEGISYDMVDMEAYAIAKVCGHSENHIPFQCYKYISDTGSNSDWEANLEKCNKELNKRFK